MRVRIHVRPGARREKFERLPDDSFAASVREEAKDNAANRRIAELVALHFSVSLTAVRILRGHHSPTKVLEVG